MKSPSKDELQVPLPALPEAQEEAVAKMNQTLALMEGQPEVVCQLFSAFLGAGVRPDAESYDRVVRAAVKQNIWECVDWLLTSAVEQGVEVTATIVQCLEAVPLVAPDGTFDPVAFMVKWVPKAQASGTAAVPERCYPVLLKESALKGGVQTAVGVYQLMLRSGARSAAASSALVEACTDLGKLGELVEICGPSGLAEPSLLSLLGAGSSRSPTPEPGAPARAPPGLTAPQHVCDLEAAEEAKDAAMATRALAELKRSQGKVTYEQYVRVLEVCVAAWSVPEALAVLEEMRAARVLDADAYNVLLRAHAAKGRFDKAEKMVEDMRRSKVTPNAATFNALLDVAARTARHEKAWQLLAQMMKQGLTADKFSVSLLLKSVAEKMDRSKVKRGLDLVEKYLDTLLRTNADDVLFNSLLDACCRVKDIPRLERTLQKMKQFDVRRSPATYGTLLKAYGQKLDLQSVLRVWHDMKAADLGVNTVTYGCMLDACVKCSAYDHADEVFEELRASGMHRNTILYSTMIKSYAKQKKLRKALRIMEEMQAEGVPLNCVTFNSLIDAAIRCRDLPAATKLLEQMKKSGISPDLITYSTLVKGFCDQGEMEVAVTLLEHLKQQGMKCDEILYNSLLEGCVKSNQAERGLELFQEMVAEKVQPSNITFSILVKVYASAGRLDAALEIVKRMEPEFKVKPSNIVFTCLVKCYVAAQRLPQAANLLLGLPKAAKIQPEQPMYVIVLPALIAQKHLDLACDVFEALCKAPLGNTDARSAPSLTALAHQLFDAVSRSSLMQKEKARRLLTGVIRQTPGLAEHEKALEAHLGPKAAGWGGQEFVPGATEFSPAAWDPAAAADYATQLHQAAYYQQLMWQQQWGMEAAYDFAHPATPQRLLPGAVDENASPNVMDILMTQDVGSSEKAPRARRRTQRAAGTPKTPVKMAPVVLATSPSALAQQLAASPAPDQLASPSK